jgi:hypothetical protein
MSKKIQYAIELWGGPKMLLSVPVLLRHGETLRNGTLNNILIYQFKINKPVHLQCFQTGRLISLQVFT